MATVTICDPLAASASRITPKSVNLPVPVIRRDVKVLPPRVNGSGVCGCCFMTNLR